MDEDEDGDAKVAKIREEVAALSVEELLKGQWPKYPLDLADDSVHGEGVVGGVLVCAGCFRRCCSLFRVVSSC